MKTRERRAGKEQEYIIMEKELRPWRRKWKKRRRRKWKKRRRRKKEERIKKAGETEEIEKKRKAKE